MSTAEVKINKMLTDCAVAYHLGAQSKLISDDASERIDGICEPGRNIHDILLHVRVGMGEEEGQKVDADDDESCVFTNFSTQW